MVSRDEDGEGDDADTCTCAACGRTFENRVALREHVYDVGQVY